MNSINFNTSKYSVAHLTLLSLYRMNKVIFWPMFNNKVTLVSKSLRGIKQM